MDVDSFRNLRRPYFWSQVHNHRASAAIVVFAIPSKKKCKDVFLFNDLCIFGHNRCSGNRLSEYRDSQIIKSKRQFIWISIPLLCCEFAWDFWNYCFAHSFCDIQAWEKGLAFRCVVCVWIGILELEYGKPSNQIHDSYYDSDLLSFYERDWKPLSLDCSMMILKGKINKYLLSLIDIS